MPHQSNHKLCFCAQPILQSCLYLNFIQKIGESYFNLLLYHSTMGLY